MTLSVSAVMMTLALLVLCSGLFQFSFASNRLRFFEHVLATKPNWRMAVEECREKDQSLVTLYDQDDVSFTFKFAPNEAVSIWLGLHKGRDDVNARLNGVPLQLNGLDGKLEHGEQICQAMDNGTLKGFNCSDRKAFMCYKDNEYALIENEPKNWCQALQYCRKHFTNLVNDTQSNEVTDEGGNRTFWTGIMYDKWEWTDGSCSTYRNWTTKPEKRKDCASQVIVQPSSSLSASNCGNDRDVLCSKGYMRIKLIKEPMAWEQALDYCNAHHSGLLRIENGDDTLAVDQWLDAFTVSEPVWIGLRQSSVFGFWIWSDRIVTYSNWKNAAQPQLPTSNQCGAINPRDYTWIDEPCWKMLPFLCEEEIVFM